MKKLFLLICFLLCSGCGIIQEKFASALPTEKPLIQINADTVITKRYFHFGALYDREYELTIGGTGEVIFKGKTSLKDDKGINEHWNISQDELDRIIEGFRCVGFFQLNDEYGNITGTHGASNTIKIVTDGSEKTIKRWLNDEKNFTLEERDLRNLELLINKIVKAEPRIRKALDFPLEYYPSESIP